jgi:hypothetical protein
VLGDRLGGRGGVTRDRRVEDPLVLGGHIALAEYDAGIAAMPLVVRRVTARDGKKCRARHFLKTFAYDSRTKYPSHTVL